MRILLNILIFFSFSFGMMAQETRLSPAEASQFQASLATKAGNLQTLSGDFVQSKHMKMMDNEAESKGKIYFKSPDVLKWEYVSPYDYKILFKDGHLYINDEGHKSITDTRANKLFGRLGKLISGSVNGNLLEDTENFDISFYRYHDLIMARLRPKDNKLARLFDEIIMLFDADNLVKSVRLQEDTGDYTKIEFINIKVNQPIPSQVFQH